MLILGAGGGVATIAISLAHAAGARVLVTTSSAEKLVHARWLGAQDGVLYTEPDWPEAIRELTGGAGVDLVVDLRRQHLAGGAADPVRRRPTGRLRRHRLLVHADRYSGLYFGQHTILGTTMGSPRDFAALLRAIRDAPRWRPVVDRVLSLDRAAEAHAAMERREHTGKLVLSID